MVKCAKCGSNLRRVHRTFFERFAYMAIYRCRRCREERVVLRRYLYHFGDFSRCPCCGTYKVTRLRQRDRIDPMVGGVLNLLERIVGGNRLCHCRYCRVQFYDHREMAPPGPAAAGILDSRGINSGVPDVPEPDPVPGPESATPKT